MAASCHNSKWNVVVVYMISFLGVIIFTKGFFPIKSTSSGFADTSNIPPVPYDTNVLTRLIEEEFTSSIASTTPDSRSRIPLSAPYRKVILIVIDAMRVDFIKAPRFAKHMPFLHKTLNDGHGMVYTAVAKAPTVTMPRLKALTTGSIPGYIDVILNMEQSTQLKEDNIISGMKRAGKRILFYGDDTWIRLFPTSFKRTDGTTSFFVNDYTEVDNNVTRHLDDELHKRNDWEVMILHYLGLDHIGHLAGPTSPLMPDKLNEMDSVIKSIYTAIQKKKDAVLIITSDHGMSGQGSHGGTTAAEVNTPLIFMSPAIENGFNIEGIQESVQQIDFAPTLSLLMGIPIPLSSMGRVISSTLNIMSQKQQLRALQYNCHQLLTLTSKSGLSGTVESVKNDPISLYRNGVQFHSAFLSGDNKDSDVMFGSAKDHYVECQKFLSSKLTSKLASYSYSEMTLGIVILSAGLCGVVYLWVKALLQSRHSKSLKNFSSKTLTRALVALTIGCILHIATLPASSFVEEEHQIWHFLTISMIFGLFFALLRSTAKAEAVLKPKSSTSSLYDALIMENDSVLRLRKDASMKSKTWQLVSESSKAMQNQVEENATANNVQVLDVQDDSKIVLDGVSKRRNIIKESHMKYIAIGFASILAHRILRAWNQTGIKYADLPDTGDWLNIPQNRTTLSFVSFLGLLLVFIMLELLCSSHDIIRTLATLCGIISVYCYRVATGCVLFPFSSVSPNMGILEARIVYLCIAGLLVKVMYHRISILCLSGTKQAKSHTCSAPRLCVCFSTPPAMRKSLDCLQSAVILLSALLLRSHNHCALAFNLFLYWAVNRIFWPIVVEGRMHLLDKSVFDLRFQLTEEYISTTEAVARVIVAHWFGQMAFFTLGNSNSLATVDLSAAYVGLSSSEGILNFLSAGFLGAFSTYAGPIIWVTLCLADVIKAISNESDDMTNVTRNYTSANVVTCTFAMLRLFTLAVYIVVATGHRYHLFVWSVFSPKLIYEVASTAVHGLLLTAAVLLW